MFAQREPVAFLGQLLQDPGISQKAEEQSKTDAPGMPQERSERGVGYHDPARKAQSRVC